MEEYKEFLFIAIIVIALGVVFSINITRPPGTIFIAIGGFYLIVSMNKKRQSEQNNQNDDKTN
jgi:hypothetical protein